MKPGLREAVAEVSLGTQHLIYPLFINDGLRTEVIESMPGQKRWCLEDLYRELEQCTKLGLRTICLFPVTPESKKDPLASYATDKGNFYLEAIRSIKKRFPNLLIMSDIALDPYSSDGHDGLVDSQTGEILNDQTLKILGEMALAQADAGVDILGPSDMMDGRVGYIRRQLEDSRSTNTLIMSYTAKYASGFYGPFRDALDSAPKNGDKKTYQMDFRNSKEAIKEARLDQMEGADILMVKPGLAYLDILYRLTQYAQIPTAVYQVSGEYAMIKAAGEKGWVDENAVMVETLTAFRRAGASYILSYFAKDFADYIKHNE
jgi:porphobilinogen synthase